MDDANIVNDTCPRCQRLGPALGAWATDLVAVENRAAALEADNRFLNEVLAATPGAPSREREQIDRELDAEAVERAVWVALLLAQRAGLTEIAGLLLTVVVESQKRARVIRETAQC